MKKSCQWASDLELKMLGPYLHSLGFKGAKVYNKETGEPLTMSTNMNNSKPFPMIKIILSNVRGGGTHYDFFVNSSQSRN